MINKYGFIGWNGKLYLPLRRFLKSLAIGLRQMEYYLIIYTIIMRKSTNKYGFIWWNGKLYLPLRRFLKNLGIINNKVMQRIVMNITQILAVRSMECIGEGRYVHTADIATTLIDIRK